ncbi:MAG: hypothetical protein AB7Y46_02125 [Armatimonadota bacterium]
MGEGAVGGITVALLDGWAELTGVNVVEQALGQLDAQARAELIARAPNWYAARRA